MSTPDFLPSRRIVGTILGCTADDAALRFRRHPWKSLYQHFSDAVKAVIEPVGVQDEVFPGFLHTQVYLNVVHELKLICHHEWKHSKSLKRHTN